MLAALAGTEGRPIALTFGSSMSGFPGIEGSRDHLEYRSAVLDHFDSVVYGVKNAISGSVKMWHNNISNSNFLFLQNIVNSAFCHHLSMFTFVTFISPFFAPYPA